MTVWIRIALYVLTGYAYGQGWIGDEVRQYLTADPEVALAVEALIAGAVLAVTLFWRKVALWRGWST